MFTIVSRRRRPPPRRFTVTVAKALSRRLLRTTAFALVAAAALLLAASPAAAAKSCGKQVINDWYGDGRVDKIYPLHCYEDAIDALPVDVRDYSSAKEDIERALQFAVRNQPDPGRSAPPEDETGSGPATGPSGSGDPGTPPGPNPDTGGPLNEVLDDIGPANADSVPIPLLALGGLALLLLAAGSAGYLRRRVLARRGSPPAA